MKSKTTAILLCFFLGNLGIHKFYLRETVWGVVYLLTAGLCGIGSLVNFVQLLLMSQEQFDAKYNSAPAE